MTKPHNLSTENLELEIKIQVSNKNHLLKWLKQNATFIKAVDQEDHYFEPPDQSFIFERTPGFKDATQWLRVRFTPKGDSINYKNCHNDTNGTFMYADEIETNLQDGHQMIAIFQALDFKETSVIKKHRETYAYGDYQFDLDEIENLGFFVEIEYQGKISDLKQGRAQINQFLQSIGIKDYQQVDTGYPQMFWNDQIIFIKEKPAKKTSKKEPPDILIERHN